jgi:bifunctional DNase/RNase
MDSLVEVVVARLGLDGSSNTYVVILRERSGERILPIWIGHPEAEAILLEINGVKKQRPMTHDLCKILIAELGASVVRTVITHVDGRTYYAQLELEREGDHMLIDARPSDGIAIALRTGSPIVVDEELLQDVPEESEADYIPAPEPHSSDVGMTKEELKRHLASLRPEDFGRFTP